jgi:hypothetical protein
VLGDELDRHPGLHGARLERQSEVPIEEILGGGVCGLLDAVGAVELEEVALPGQSALLLATGRSEQLLGDGLLDAAAPVDQLSWQGADDEVGPDLTLSKALDATGP